MGQGHHRTPSARVRFPARGGQPADLSRGDAGRTRKMLRQIDGPVVLVGHSYGGAVITEAGDLPHVAALVHIAAFAPDSGEIPGRISQDTPPAAFENLAPDSDGYLWIKQDKFHESFAQDPPADEALVMSVTQKAPWRRRSATTSRLRPGVPSRPGIRSRRPTA
ncbi:MULTISPECIES: alpha/beta hydrolase [Streptomyces]|uniref:alpha/beta hydrolase n=1 Tax=Streptomyces TaxID=1883 RepID=UPI00325B13AC